MGTLEKPESAVITGETLIVFFHTLLHKSRTWILHILWRSLGTCKDFLAGVAVSCLVTRCSFTVNMLPRHNGNGNCILYSWIKVCRSLFSPDLLCCHSKWRCFYQVLEKLEMPAFNSAFLAQSVDQHEWLCGLIKEFF